jgi:hypothetical protein
MVLSIILDTKIAEAYKVEEVQAVVTVIEPQPIQIEITYSEARIKELIRETFKNNAATMIRVASCEGGIRDDAPTNPTNGSFDKGIYQVSEKYHGAEAKALGLDLHDVRDNIKFAKLLYDREGLTPWTASKHCWSK